MGGGPCVPHDRDLRIPARPRPSEVATQPDQSQVKIVSSPMQKVLFPSPWHVPSHLHAMCAKTLLFRRVLACTSCEQGKSHLVRKVCCRAPQCQLRPQPHFEPYQACQQLDFLSDWRHGLPSTVVLGFGVQNLFGVQFWALVPSACRL